MPQGFTVRVHEKTERKDKTMRLNSVTLIGCGGTGSLLVQPLARLLAFNENTDMCVLHLWDGDSFEKRNEARQISFIDMNKAVAAHSLVEHLVPGKVLDRYALGKESFVEHIHECVHEAEGKPWGLHVIVTAVDNSATRKMCYDAMSDIKDDISVAIVDPGNGEGQANVTTWLRIMGREPLAWPPELYHNLRDPKDRPPGADCLEETESGQTQTIAENMMAAALTTAVVLTTASRRIRGPSNRIYRLIVFGCPRW